tara:strand:+ start:718 stop:1335 length:618 start_codon:yes stop_codon:yes gene_type:complete
MTPLAAECALVETGLRASAFIYSETRKRVREKDEHVPIEDLKAVKKAALDMNRCFAKYVKQSRGQIDRLLIELHLMRNTIQRDATDRDANRARAYNLLREYRQTASAASSGNGNGTDLPPLVSQPLGAAGALSASMAPITAGSVAVDRAIAAAARLENSVLSLSPTGVSHLHGAGILAQMKGRAYVMAATTATTATTATPPPPPA